MDVSGGEGSTRRGPSLMPGSQEPPGLRRRPLCYQRRPRWRWELRQDGPQWNREFAVVFEEWNCVELASFLIEIKADNFRVRDEHGDGEQWKRSSIRRGWKGTGKWTALQPPENSQCDRSDDCGLPRFQVSQWIEGGARGCLQCS
ncbi:Phosphogluconate dehydrogenase (NADP(+)-dependent decarboxylating) protein [Dioscorea alata]|uniref:Phosphogluconate dehydrogenase (NADP(+)-dependent decarboxylating) protein n=1 Tax=Dioscorea alata TaxID=55571 RepID=A0ACB7VQS7_DIOAL|nr:Phosphogluconate dehydrogenase (NADP(+)-dependent decarboxylating) protein [Dioscorea alata]